MQNQLVTVKTEVLNCLKSEVHKHDIEENCTRTHDSKRKRNLKKSKSEENISVEMLLMMCLVRRIKFFQMRMILKSFREKEWKEI